MRRQPALMKGIDKLAKRSDDVLLYTQKTTMETATQIDRCPPRFAIQTHRVDGGAGV
jgi:hypothetical protein